MKKTNIVLLVIIAICVAVVAMMVGDFSTYETFATSRSKPGKEIHVIGALDTTKALVYDPQKDANYFSFYMKDKSGELRQVIFTGTKPTDFEKSTELVLTGQMDGDIFVCNKILMKCPSKYKDDQEVVGIKQA
ncbi:cytochrome c-type biogenesis protein CcmE [Chitinophaga skermanii]|uniref:Cytochrome c-type biogenesis protein CcmE n=1 Tax=Chitinophaga skermanii TaxID=331697 RepID=A0A327QSH8_9BACT|nr:cytochrome c maturation protein CcmE [Chitinophaga skermanii]RAJ06908.1 cytochrome c-type biogenesis protein CcmE [Chitinophaga skermanii]